MVVWLVVSGIILGILFVIYGGFNFSHSLMRSIGFALFNTLLLAGAVYLIFTAFKVI